MAEPIVGLGVPAAALLYELVGNPLLGRYAGTPLDERRLDDRRRRAILKRVGAHPKTPWTEVEAEEGDEPSAFVDPSNIEAAQTAFNLKLTPAQKRLAEKHGVILTHPRSSSAVFAHEAGHAAEQQQHKRPFWPYALSTGLAGIGGALAGGIGGHYFKSPYAGMGIGGLTALALGAPMLYEEYRASRRADEQLKKDEKRKWPGRKRLGSAFLTYLGSALAPALAVGAYTGYKASQ